MALNWETFKSALGPFSKTPVIYIDDEGSEVPIDCECEFQEALRLAKLNKNNLKLILYHKAKFDETVHMGRCEPVQFTENPPEKFLECKTKNMSTVPHSSKPKENTCPTHSDVPPEWFKRYIKKFKKELLHELKSYIDNAVHSAIEEEKHLSHTRKVTIGSFFGHSLCSAGTQSKKKKKILEKDLSDLIDQRQVKLPKKLSATRSERLEMLDQKTKEEKMKSIESKHPYKTKCFGAFDKKTTNKKSASFLRSSVCVDLDNASKFSVVIHMANDGDVRWSYPQLECFEIMGLFPNENRINLHRLSPLEKYFTVLTGTASESPGLHYFKCRVVDGLEKLGPELTCWTKVGSLDSPKNFLSDSLSQKGVTTDFENELISSSKKKIEENINEIERRLRDIDLLQPSILVETPPGGGKQMNKMSDEFQTGCALTQDFEKKDMSDQREVSVENSSLGAVTPSRMCSSEITTEKEKNESPVNLNKIKKDEEIESSSDSELSIIFISEDEDNFTVVDTECECSFLGTPEIEEDLLITEFDQLTGSTEKAESIPTKPEIKDEVQVRTEQDEATPNEMIRQSQFSPTRSRCSSFGEEISKPKKMKSKSTEYRFTAANLTQPTFTLNSGFFEGRPSRFTFTGEKEEKSTKCKRPINGPQKTAHVPKRDSLGRHIYAVKSNGYCLSVENMLIGETHGEREPPKNIGRDQEIQNPSERKNEEPSESPMTKILPNVLNAVLKTAKSVYRNAQSVMKTEGKPESGQPADEDREKKMSKLFDMGFTDYDINERLLAKHDYNLQVVVNELLRKFENPQ